MSTKQGQQEFQFVAYNGASNKESLSTIKRHVMNDYFRKQAKSDTTQVANTGRTRSKYHVEPSDSAEILRSHARPVKTTKDRSFASSSRVIEGLVSRPASSAPKKSSEICSTTSQKAPLIHTSSSPGAHRSDPFDTLPVKQIPDDLIEWFPCLYEDDMKNASWVHKSNVLWAKNIWHSSTQDTGLFYTVLSQAERNRMVMTRSADNRRYLFLRGQALQALRKRISATTKDDPNTLILLVAYQIRFAIVEGDFETAHTHLQAASVLIAREGDKVGPFVMVHASLMDVKLAAASWTRPKLEFKDPHLRLQTSARLAEVVKNRTLTSLSHFPRDFRNAAAEEAMAGLHWHFLKFDANYGKEVDGSFAVLLNCVRTARHLRGLAADAWEEIRDEEDSETVNPRIAIVLCIEFFAWMHDPAHIIPWISHSEYMKRLGDNVRSKLKRCLNLGHGDFVGSWKETGASSESLLWILMIGFVMTANTEIEADGYADSSLPFLRAMSRVMSDLDISDQMQLEQTLKAFPWTDNFCGTWSKSIVARLGLPVSVEVEEVFF